MIMLSAVHAKSYESDQSVCSSDRHCVWKTRYVVHPGFVSLSMRQDRIVAFPSRPFRQAVACTSFHLQCKAVFHSLPFIIDFSPPCSSCFYVLCLLWSFFSDSPPFTTLLLIEVKLSHEALRTVLFSPHIKTFFLVGMCASCVYVCRIKHNFEEEISTTGLVNHSQSFLPVLSCMQSLTSQQPSTHTSILCLWVFPLFGLWETCSSLLSSFVFLSLHFAGWRWGIDQKQNGWAVLQDPPVLTDFKAGWVCVCVSGCGGAWQREGE